MHSTRNHTALIAALLLTGPVCAADLANGKTLHDSICKTCHQSDYYTRENSIVHSGDELKAQVTRCQDSAGEEWTASQIEDVVAYLNTTYYKFK